MTIQKLKQDSVPDLVLVDVDTIQLPAATITIGGRQYETSTLTMDIDISGAGGLDTGSRAANTLYYMYTVVDSGIVKLIASTSSSLPTGFSYATQVGKFRTFYATTDIAAVSSSKEITEWQTYTPWTTQGFGTIANNRLEWRRSKNEIQVRGGFNAGTVSGSVALTGLPNQYRCKFIVNGPSPEEAAVGKGYRDASSTTHFCILAFNLEQYVRYGRFNSIDTAGGGAGENTLSSQTGNAIVNTGQRISLYFSVPIAEFEDLY